MTVKLKIRPDEIKVRVTNNVKVRVTNPKKHLIEFELMLRKALNGDLLIFDHSDIDIVVMPEKKKIVAFAKELMTESVYGAESRLFEFLKKKGIIAYDSIQGGNVYGSLEAQMHESKEVDEVKVALYEISQWIEEERPYLDSIKSHNQMSKDAILNPDDEYSTEFGEVPHEEKKGSIHQHGIFSPYLYGKYTY